MLGLAFWRLAELGAEVGGLSGASRRFTGSYEAQPRAPGVFPVVSWLNDRPTRVDTDEWRLRIGGSADRDLIFP